MATHTRSRAELLDVVIQEDTIEYHIEDGVKMKHKIEPLLLQASHDDVIMEYITSC